MLKPTVGIFVGSSLLYFFSFPGVDNDLWGHLFFGREIVQRGQLPLTNLFSYTVPHHPWVNHEWLAEVIFYEVYSNLGSPGLVLLKVVIGSSIVCMLNGIIRQRVSSIWARVIALVWLMALLSPGRRFSLISFFPRFSTFSIGANKKVPMHFTGHLC